MPAYTPSPPGNPSPLRPVKKGGSPPPRTTPPGMDWRVLAFQLVLFLGLVWLWQEGLSRTLVRTLPYSEFKHLLAAGQVTDCRVTDTEIEGLVDPARRLPAAAAPAPGSPTTAAPAAAPVPVPAPSAAPAVAAAPATSPAAPTPAAGSPVPAASPAVAGKAPDNKPYPFRTVRVDDPKLTAQLQAAGVNFSGVRPSFVAGLITAWGVPLLFLGLIWFGLRRMAGSAGSAVLNVGRSRARLVPDKESNVTFADVAGCDEAKFELQEVVDFLKHPQRYQELGAKIPKGVLLVGPPGTGKTLLARAVAGEAKVPFFLISGSDFVEMFVGVGASRVRDLFRQAKEQGSCIVFIDELDAIGRQRGVHLGGGNDEREQTLNQLLVEMDGFSPNQGVILLAATNRPEVLDRALLRPGRFDRTVVVDSPDVDGREAILRVHVKGKPIGPNVSLRDVAQSTPGFSGADLANLINEAALLAARAHDHEIYQHHLQEALEKVVAGPERKSRRLGETEKRRVAYHEVGHALVAAFTDNPDRVRKISIVPRGRAALGFTMQLPADQQFLMTRDEILDRVSGLLGGRAAEEVVFGEVTTGAENDLDRATAMVRQMVCVYGMSNVVGLAHLARRSNSFLGDGLEGGGQQLDCSEETAQAIDREVKQLLNQAYGRAKQTLQEHRDQLEKISAELLRVEAMEGERFYQLIDRPAPASILPEIPFPSPLGGGGGGTNGTAS